MSHSESDSAAADKDAFSLLRISQHLVPSQPPPVLSTFTHLDFPANHTVPSRDSNPVHSQQQQPLGDVIRVSLRVDASPGCGGIAWPAGKTVAADKEVIELGSGTGLVGLVAASSGAKRVWMTDQAPMLDIMRANVALNTLADTVQVLEYNWGFPRPDALPPHADLILAADCVYFEPAFPLLVSTLCDLVPLDSSDTAVLFCYKKRRKADKRFFALLKKHFDWNQANVMRFTWECLAFGRADPTERGLMRIIKDHNHDRLAPVEDDPDYPIYSREAISLLRLTRKR